MRPDSSCRRAGLSHEGVWGAWLTPSLTTSVTDSYGRTHDHENVFVIGAATMVSGGCANGTPTFCALSLRSAEEIARGL